MSRKPSQKPRGHSASMAHVNPDRDPVNFAPTAPWGGRAGGEIVRRLDPHARSAWEPACGGGHLVHGLDDYFPVVHASDAYCYGGTVRYDFVAGADADAPFVADWIITNPPFDHVDAFILNAWRRARRGVALLLATRALEGITRYGTLYEAAPLAYLAPFSERLPIVMGRWDPEQSSAAFYSWFIWLKPGVGPRRRGPAWSGSTWSAIPIKPGTYARLTRPSDLAFAAREAA